MNDEGNCPLDSNGFDLGLTCSFGLTICLFVCQCSTTNLNLLLWSL